MKNWVLAIALGLITPSSYAGYLTADDLLKKLESKRSADRESATMYILGVHDSYNPGISCVEAGTKPETLSNMVQYMFKRNPQILPGPADTAVISVLGFAWPCKNEPIREPSKKNNTML